MKERYRTRFVGLLKKGAAVQDIHDSPAALGFAVTTAADNHFIERELGRVDHHRRNACSLIEDHVGRARSILDAGCGTGGFTVAMALSEVLRPTEIIGVDASSLALEAAEARAAGYGLSFPLVSFLGCAPGQPLPFDNDYFDLTVCSSVLEFVTSERDRIRLITELGRVTRPGGHVFISMPNPLRLREYHSGRFLGDYFRRPGYPWASSPRQLSRLFSGWHDIPSQNIIAERSQPVWELTRRCRNLYSRRFRASRLGKINYFARKARPPVAHPGNPYPRPLLELRSEIARAANRITYG